MRILCAVTLTSSLLLKCIHAITFAAPLTGSLPTAGVPFQVDWHWDGTPSGYDGTLDIILVKDSAATSVVAQLLFGAYAGNVGTSATISQSTPSGQYYIQLKVTSGTESSSVGGPFNVVNTPNNTTQALLAGAQLHLKAPLAAPLP
ncbi:hypothetical protein Unana1_05612 [Umbelopsis nana]